MAATEQLQPFGRITSASVQTELLFVCITANGATYATASGGLPIDLTTYLVQGAQNDQAYINPADVVGFLPLVSTNKFLAGAFVVGTPTYTTNVGSGYGSASGLPPIGSTQGFETQKTLATCPATIRLYGTGASNAAAFAEVADGANTDVFYGFLVIATGGVNQ